MNTTKKKKSAKKDNPAHWDTNAHTILLLESLLRDATTPGQKHALKRALRIMRAIDDAQ